MAQSTVNIRQNGALGNMNPSSELISEFKVTQFNNNAEFSQLGDVNHQHENGTDKFHGSAFEYFQNSAFDAAVWDRISTEHAENRTSFPPRLAKPGWASVDPGNGRGKIQNIFFADYEGNRKRYSTPLFLFVPTVAMRSGDFSALTAPLTDPFTGKPYAGNKIQAESNVRTAKIASTRWQRACSTTFGSRTSR